MAHLKFLAKWKISSSHEKSFSFNKLIWSLKALSMTRCDIRQKQTSFECKIQNPMIIYARLISQCCTLHSVVRTKPYLIVRSVTRFIGNASQFHILSLECHECIRIEFTIDSCSHKSGFVRRSIRFENVIFIFEFFHL